MIEKLVADINKALENNAYVSALSLALTLPDICGKAKYPNKKVGERYIEWYDEYVGRYEQNPNRQFDKEKTPYLSGEVVYSLRNSMLHQGTPNIDNSKINDSTNKIDKFTLIIEKKNEFDIYADSSSVCTSYAGNDYTGTTRTYEVNIRRLCLILTLCARGYYRENKEQFNFFNFTVMDWDEEVKKMQSWRQLNDTNRKTI